MSAIPETSKVVGLPARMVSPRQAALGAFIGGPIAFAWLIGKNYAAIGDRAAAKKTVAICTLAIVAWNAAIVLVVLLPNPVWAMLMLAFQTTPIVLALAAHGIAQRQSIAGFGVHEACSNLYVLGGAVLGFVGTVLCVLPAVFVVVAVTLGGFR